MQTTMSLVLSGQNYNHAMLVEPQVCRSRIVVSAKTECPYVTSGCHVHVMVMLALTLPCVEMFSLLRCRAHIYIHLLLLTCVPPLSFS